jgi:hypothetical protein
MENVVCVRQSLCFYSNHVPEYLYGPIPSLSLNSKLPIQPQPTLPDPQVPPPSPPPPPSPTILAPAPPHVPAALPRANGGALERCDTPDVLPTCMCVCVWWWIFVTCVCVCLGNTWGDHVAGNAGAGAFCMYDRARLKL